MNKKYSATRIAIDTFCARRGFLCRIESPNKIVDECDINVNSILNAVIEERNDENVSFNDEHLKISN